ncbi:MAG: M67 family metallopeptidase [Synechococcus sp. ELA057]
MLTQLRRTLVAALPEEGCALLLGEPLPQPSFAVGSQWRLTRIWPCRNSWMPQQERFRRFALDPREQLLAQRWARQRGLAVLGSAHSHPRGQPRPSGTDLALAYTPALQLILAPADGWRPRAWWLEATPAGPAAAIAVPCRLDPPSLWRMED